jgi:mono/diheme cytochrome c family protein
MKRASFFSAAIGSLLIVAPSAGAVAQSNPDLVKRGEYLARAGDCTACHTATGGKPFAGGDALASPFGPIYPSNITPDKETGIGSWNDEDFYRAMHNGVGKHGEYLYPAFPYPWFTKISRDDTMALKAYLDSVAPVNAKPPQTKLMFPFDVRLGIGGWNAAFFKPGEFKPDANKPEDWNRGAYLVEGLGHCGDCHTPKGVAMEPLRSKAFTGGAIDNWFAPNITPDAVQGIGAWSVDDLVAYFKTGVARGKPPAAGPMAQVVRDSLSYLNDSDLRAIATYLKSNPPQKSYKEDPSAAFKGPHAPGETIYVSQCSYCHQLNGKGRPGAIPALDGNGVVLAKGPEDVIRVVLGGLLARGPYAPMPAVGAGMSDTDIAAVVDYVRNAWSNAAPISVSDSGIVGKIRAETHTMLSGRTAPGADPCALDADAPAIKPIVDPEHQIERTLTEMKADQMQDSIGQAVSRAREVAPDASRADIVNSLTLAYCRVEFSEGKGTGTPENRGALNRFSQLVYTWLVTNGK